MVRLMEIKTTDEIIEKDSFQNKKWVAVDDVLKELETLERYVIFRDFEKIYVLELIKELTGAKGE